MADEKGLCTTILSLRVLGLPKKVLVHKSLLGFRL